MEIFTPSLQCLWFARPADPCDEVNLEPEEEQLAVQVLRVWCVRACVRARVCMCVGKPPADAVVWSDWPALSQELTYLKS